MPDWQELVRQRLEGLRLDPTEKEEVHAELAAHLEETYEALLREGMTEPDAIQRALSLANDWNDLQRKIHSARAGKDIMTNRVTQLWLPGLLTFTLSMGLLALTEIFGPKPWTTWGHNTPIALFYIPWLFSLPFVGGFGAYLSHRAGGSRRAIFFSIIFSILPFFATILVVFAIVMAFDRVLAHHMQPMAFLMFLFGWVFVPGVALLVGGLPAQLFLSRRLSSGRMASN